MHNLHSDLAHAFPGGRRRGMLSGLMEFDITCVTVSQRHSGMSARHCEKK
jgi:hypothetical protein